MACDNSLFRRNDLLQLDDQLLDEGFGFLMSLLPRELFHLYNQRIVISDWQHDLQDQNEKENIVVAYVCTSGDVPTLNVSVEAEAFAEHDFPPSSKRKRGDPSVELVRIGPAELHALSRAPPLSWHEALDNAYERSPECRHHTIALIKYYLLVWASKNNFDAPLPQPNYAHLVAAFEQLKTTRHYRHKEVINEDEDRVDVQMCLRKGDEISPSSRPFSIGQKESGMANLHDEDAAPGPSARSSRASSSACQTAVATEQPRESAEAVELPTPHDTPTQSNLDVDMPDSLEDITRATSVTSAELATTSLLDNDVSLSLETEALIRQSLPTPDTMAEETIVETDPTLRDIQKKLGQDTLSLLPTLDTCTFEKIHTKEKGFLSLRLLLGTFREDTSQLDLEGCEAWASFKMHDKGEKAAPRMHVHAFRAGTDQAVEDNLKIKDVLPDVRLGPAFNSIQGGDRAAELLLKALVKYYFILAARDRVLGFDEHKMPYNGSFVEQLRQACKRLNTSSSDDQRAQSRPLKRVKRSHNSTSQPPASLSDADEDGSGIRTREARRSGRRTGQTSSAAVSENEDGTWSPAMNLPVAAPAPRRLAFGARIFPGMEAPAANEFLDPDAMAADSDGDSGDEIPPPISESTCAFLEKRHITLALAKSVGDGVRRYRTRPQGTNMAVRKAKGTLNKMPMATAERAEAERKLAHCRVAETTARTHLAMREKGLEGWKARVKMINKEALDIDPRVMETWDVLYRI